MSAFLINVSETQSFEAKFRDIFKKTTVKIISAKQAKRWVGGPNYDYWPKQLNFAVWCATSGCGMSLSENYPPIIQQFCKFHVYFTIRRILYEFGVPLPDDSVFNQIKNRHNKAAFHRLCLEFNLDQNPDFRWMGGRNHGLGDVFDDEGYNVHKDRPRILRRIHGLIRH